MNDNFLFIYCKWNWASDKAYLSVVINLFVIQEGEVILYVYKKIVILDSDVYDYHEPMTILKDVFFCNKIIMIVHCVGLVILYLCGFLRNYKCFLQQFFFILQYVSP